MTASAHHGQPAPAEHPSTGAVALAHPNIALVKYWGKRDARLNLPAAGSLSITLDTLVTRTEVTFDADLTDDTVHLTDDTVHPTSGTRAAPRRRIIGLLDLVRQRAGTELRAHVTSSNNFPTGAGLASSASGFAALALAASHAAGLDLAPRELSALARRGSGSAARSVAGGYVVMDPGTRSDGSDAVGRQLLPAAAWPLTVVIAVTSTEAKHVPSTAGMAASQASSPFYDAWVRQVPADLAEATAAIGGRDFAALAAVAESSCLAMHAVMLAARPGLVYLRGASVDCLHRIRHLRERDGRAVFFTIDAGPQVKAVCLPRDAAAVAAALGEVPGVERVMTVGLGDGARLESPGDAPRRGEA